MTGLTRQLAGYATSTTLADIPLVVQREGVRAFLNWFGCALGGARELPVLTALAVIREQQMPPQATVLGHDLRVDLQNAALLNCLSSNLTAFDDTHLASVTHPTCTVASAMLAVAEAGKISGADFLLALILGIEIECRIANVLTTPPARSNVGLYMTSLVGGIGAAIGCGRLLGLTEDQMLHAIGIAASQASGFREAHPTMSLGFVPGHAARSGLFAAQLAAKGFTNIETSLEGTKGFAHVYADPPNFAAGIAGLGIDFEVMRNAYKPYPCGIVIHPQIDACLEIAATPGFDPHTIERVELTVEPLTLTLCDRPDPVSLDRRCPAAPPRRPGGRRQLHGPRPRHDRAPPPHRSDPRSGAGPGRGQGRGLPEGWQVPDRPRYPLSRQSGPPHDRRGIATEIRFPGFAKPARRPGRQSCLAVLEPADARRCWRRNPRRTCLRRQSE